MTITRDPTFMLHLGLIITFLFSLNGFLEAAKSDPSSPSSTSTLPSHAITSAAPSLTPTVTRSSMKPSKNSTRSETTSTTELPETGASGHHVEDCFLLGSAPKNRLKCLHCFEGTALECASSQTVQSCPHVSDDTYSVCVIEKNKSNFRKYCGILVDPLSENSTLRTWHVTAGPTRGVFLDTYTCDKDCCNRLAGVDWGPTTPSLTITIVPLPFLVACILGCAALLHFNM